MSQRIGTIKHLAQMPEATMALSILNRLAERVKPIMDKHDLKINTLEEFYPTDWLRGLNCDQGDTVLIRLREIGDESKFRSERRIIDTMLHELTHNRHLGHGDDFQSYLQELRQEYDSIYGPVKWPA
jgi:hypothetical protein